MSKRCRWSTQDDRTLIDILLKQKASGNQSQSGWKATVWSTVAAELKKDSADDRVEKTAAKCSDHYSNLKADFVRIRRLRDMSGFGWDDGSKLVVAADEQWDELAKKDPRIKKWKTTPFPIFDEMHSLVHGIIATGSGAFQAGAPPVPKLSQPATRKEPSIEWTENSQSTEHTTPPHSPSEQDTAGSGAANNSEAVPKKRQRSNTPEPSRSRKHRRQQKQDQTEGLITKMTEVAETLCSSIQPVSIPLQSPRQRKAEAIKLMEADGDFEKSECIPVIHLFTSSIDTVDSYLAIADQEVRTMYVKDSLKTAS